MTVSEYISLDDGIYEFHKYNGDLVIGIPTVGTGKEIICFVIPPSKIKEYNERSDQVEQLLEEGILISINPEVIERFTKIQ